MSKFYAVKNGKKTGIFSTWDECKEQVFGFKGAIYKSFKTLSEAEAFLEGNKEKIANIEEVKMGIKNMNTNMLEIEKIIQIYIT